MPYTQAPETGPQPNNHAMTNEIAELEARRHRLADEANRCLIESAQKLLQASLAGGQFPLFVEAIVRDAKEHLERYQRVQGELDAVESLIEKVKPNQFVSPDDL